MTDFSKVHGPGYDPANHLRLENNQLKGTIQALQQEMINRALPRINEITDVLNILAQNAKQGNAPAKEQLRTFCAALDAARDGASAIVVVRNGGGPPSPS